MHKELGGDTAGTGDPTYPEEYYISYGNMLSIQSWGKKKEAGANSE